MENNPFTWVDVLLGGGLVTALATAFMSLRRFPLEKKEAQLNEQETTVSIALDTLTAVNEQYKEIQKKHVELEEKLDKVQRELNNQFSLISQFRKYIIHIFDNWHMVRNEDEPPRLTDEIKLTIFKEK